MKKVLVIALLTLSIVANCVAFAADTTNDATASDTTNVESARPEKAEKPAKPDKSVKDEAPAGTQAKHEKSAKDETSAEAPIKPEKEDGHNETPVKPEKPEVPAKPETEDATTEDSATEDGVTEDAITGESAAEDTTNESEEATDEEAKPEKKPMGKKDFREKKEEMKKEKPEKKEYMKGIKGLFKRCDKEARKDILDEIAESKKEEQDDSVDTFIDGEVVDFEKYDNIKPIIHNGSALVPVRAVTEAYGAEVEWDDETQTITITKDETVIVLQIGSLTALVNGEEVELNVAPEIHKGRTLVPIRFVAEAFELDVEWDNDSRTIIVE